MQMMQQDTYSQAVKQYRDLIDSSLADMPVPEAPKPPRTEDISEAPGHGTAGMHINRIRFLISSALCTSATFIFVRVKYKLIDSCLLDAVEGVPEVTEESDEDLDADKRRAQLAARPVPAPTANAHNTSAGQGSHQDSNEMQSKAEKNMRSLGTADVIREPIHIRSRSSRGPEYCSMLFLFLDVAKTLLDLLVAFANTPLS